MRGNKNRNLMHNHIERLISNSSEYAPPDVPPDDVIDDCTTKDDVKLATSERQSTSVEPDFP